MEPSDPFEAWGLRRCPLEQLSRLEPLVAQLSESFTAGRPTTFENYLESPDLLTAYTLFFAPQSAARMRAALQGILARLPAFPRRPLRVLDLGSGMGPAARAASDLLLEVTGHRPEVMCVDRSEAALAVARELVPQVTTCKADLTSFVPEGTWDVILSSFAFNEAFPDLREAVTTLRRCADHLSRETPAFLLLLEPADRRGVPRLHALRSELKELPLYAPCPHTRPCPMISTRDGICHDVRRFRPTRSMVLLNRKLFRTISDVKYALLAFGAPGGPEAEGMNAPEFLRMVGPMERGKGVIGCRVCMGDGRLCRLEMPSAALDTERRHGLLERERGDCAWLDGPLEVRKALPGNVQRSADLRFTDEAPPELDAPEDDAFSFGI